jgi:hypothetical protein
MLHVPETHVARSRFPAIDFHTHLTWIDRKGKADVVHHNATPEEILKSHGCKEHPHHGQPHWRIRRVTWKKQSAHWQQPHPDRFIVFTEPWYAKITMPNFPQFQAEQLEAAKKAGARGLKILKDSRALPARKCNHRSAGEGRRQTIRRNVEAAGALNMPVAIHVSDPEAFFLPTDRFNETLRRAQRASGLVPFMERIFRVMRSFRKHATE